MPWNWTLPEWPKFSWNAEKLKHFEAIFLENRGVIIGASQHLNHEDKQRVIIELMSIDALTTSEIEGEYLNRESIQSSIRRALGLQTDRRSANPTEAGVAEMLVNLYQKFNSPLSETILCDWHQMIMNGRRDVICIGMYRAHMDEMQIVSGPDYAPRVHFEAPPADRISDEMERLLTWIQDSSSKGLNPLGAITRAGIAHLWFESIHPFEDGNGRIGRAISEKILAEGSEVPAMTGLSKEILKRRREYYSALANASHRLEITDWLLWFAELTLKSQKSTLDQIIFIIQKSRIMERVRGNINLRQEKVLLRMFREGPEGFIGGMSASKYIRITGASTPTATRDLNDLVEKKVLMKTGERKTTRYFLVLN